MLEEAADDSSFCSSSSKVKNLITSTDAMPSPIAKTNMASSTPKRNGTELDTIYEQMGEANSPTENLTFQDRTQST